MDNFWSEIITAIVTAIVSILSTIGILKKKDN
jgi:hypothetical protein